MKLIKQHPEITVIFLIGLILRLFYAQLDPYLHEWDERFHALVAQNIIDSPLIPMLFKNPVVPYDLNSWCCNSVWLHKQPLFMWQMAISMKVFGVSEFSMRLPSALMGAITILLIYRIAFLLTNSKTISIIAGLLMCFSHYQLELISGQIGMDHNDMAFCFYILASFWAFTEKIVNKKIIWNLVIGVFAGCAILNKWLVGLLVFLPFGIYVLQEIILKKEFKQVKLFALSIICCVAVFLPWQLYILHKFNELAMYEYNFSSQHIFKTIEGHTGNFLFYLMKFGVYFGNPVWLFVIAGIVIAFAKNNHFNKTINTSIFISFITVFCFFSFIAQSKLATYFFIVVPFGLIYLAIGIYKLLNKINIKWINYLIIVVVVVLSFNPYKSFAIRKENPEREKLIYNTQIYKSLKNLIPEHIKTVVNVNSFENTNLMFYNNDITAYHWWIDVKHLDSLKNNKVWIGAFKNHGDYNLPPEYNNYPYLYLIDTLLKQ